MKKYIIITIVAFVFIFPFTTTIVAHSGRTDSLGGHWDHSTGTYHYHSGSSSQLEIDFSVISIICVILGVIVIVLIAIAFFLNKKYLGFYSHSFFVSIENKLQSISNKGFISLNAQSPIEDNYKFIDIILETQSELKNAKRFYIQKCESHSSNTEELIKRITLACFIIFAVILFLLSCTIFTYKVWLLWIIAISIVLLIFYFVVIYRINKYYQGKSNSFIQKIDIYTNDSLHSLNLFACNQINKFDIYKFLGIPSDVILKEHLKDSKNSESIIPYGAITRYISPKGKCFHKKFLCSSASIPINIYEAIKHYEPCAKCSYKDKSIYVPEWYKYYIKTCSILNHLKL